MPFPQLTVIIALLQAGAAKNTGISSPATCQGLHSLSAEQTMYSSYSSVLQKLYSRQEWLSNLGLPFSTQPSLKWWRPYSRHIQPKILIPDCLSLLTYRWDRVSMPEEASQDQKSMPHLRRDVTSREVSHFPYPKV